ncbi:MAG: S46 family peptidase [Pseudomonadota bacterium]|nr:S46 family peptidase [Pseudomonadota bacterium]
MLLLALVVPALLAPAHAVEGMWEPAQLPSLAGPLQTAGFPGDAAALARLDAAPLGAVVSISGCTASFVSTDGLLVTNHHCVVDDLQQAQKEGENLVATGFYAPTRADERSAGPGGRVYITEATVDVTDKVLGKVGGGKGRLSDLDLKARIDDATKKLVSGCEKASPGRRCRVASFYEGLRYSLITQVELRDVRVVMAPADSVGNYGDQIDNWHWPRHAGDFGFLRAYVGPDGKPADYAVDNVPYHPAHTLAVNAAGVDPGGFVMVAGYAGRTERWQTGLELERDATIGMPRRIARSEWLLDLYAQMVKEDPTAEPLLNVSRSYVSNRLFNDKGAVEGFRRAGVVDTATARDVALDAWVAADPARSAKYAAAIAELRTVVTRGDATRDRDEVLGWIGRADLLQASRTLLRLGKEREKPDAKREIGFQARDLPRIKASLVGMQKSLHIETERRFLRALLLEAAQLPPEQQSPELMAWLGASGGLGTPEARVDKAIARLFTDPAVDTVAEREALFGAKASTITASTDGFLSLAVALWPYDEARRQESKSDAGALARLRPLYADALRQMDPARSYPDANGTLRVTFGTVQGYDGRDGVRYLPQTRIEGIVEKAGPPPFDAPPALLAAIRDGKRGPYADAKLGSVPVDFLSDLDITGGNSGSPTIDAKGALVGLAFDGNYEGIASDWLFDAKNARTIHVDVRYVLYYLDAVANADALLKELGVSPTW